ncbi:MAG: RNA 2'-phosphotransferase [Thermodesulfobacteriota bacterium]
MNTAQDRTSISKYLAYLLRHNPRELDLELDESGWADAAILLERLASRRQIVLTPRDLEELVATDKKGRYSLKDGRIRANQGHSIEVMAVDPVPKEPPEELFHGTTEQRWSKIQSTGGLRKMARHHVHLSADVQSAWLVATRRRRESPLVLGVDARRMWQDGFLFYLSDNGVWLVDNAPCEYLKPLPKNKARS